MKGTWAKQRLPRFLREYRGEVPCCPGGVGAYGWSVIHVMPGDYCEIGGSDLPGSGE